MITVTNIVIALAVLTGAAAILFRGVLRYAESCWEQGDQ